MADLQDLRAKVADSIFVMSIDPGDELDPKIVYETGMMILLNKPIALVIQPHIHAPNAGLLRHADVVIELSEPVDSMDSQMKIQAGLEELRRRFPSG